MLWKSKAFLSFSKRIRKYISIVSRRDYIFFFNIAYNHTMICLSFVYYLLMKTFYCIYYSFFVFVFPKASACSITVAVYHSFKRMCVVSASRRPVHVSVIILRLVLLWARVCPLAFPAVRVKALLLLGQSFRFHGVHPPLLVLHLLPFIAQNHADGSVVFPGVHLCVLHPVLLGKKHEGVHWPLALCGRGSRAP